MQVLVNCKKLSTNISLPLSERNRQQQKNIRKRDVNNNIDIIQNFGKSAISDSIFIHMFLNTHDSIKNENYSYTIFSILCRFVRL